MTAADPPAPERRPSGDLEPPRLLTPGGATIRSVAVPGWGLLAVGDARGVLVLALAVAGLAAFVVMALPYVGGTLVELVFLAGAALVLGWAAQALIAWRRAVRRREALGLATDDGGALAVLWLAPVAIAAATVFWSVAGAGASPGSRAAAYVGAWWEDRPEAAADDFVPPLDPAAIEAAWGRQADRLHNALVRAAAEAPAGGIDPDRPFESIRFSEDQAAGAADTARTIRMDIVSRVLVQDRLLGVLPTTSQRLETVAEVGSIELQLERAPGPLEGSPPVETWRIVQVTVLGEALPG